MFVTINLKELRGRGIPADLVDASMDTVTVDIRPLAGTGVSTESVWNLDGLESARTRLGLSDEDMTVVTEQAMDTLERELICRLFR